jgi:hypothetical protein
VVSSVPRRFFENVLSKKDAEKVPRDGTRTGIDYQICPDVVKKKRPRSFLRIFRLASSSRHDISAWTSRAWRCGHE